MLRTGLGAFDPRAAANVSLIQSGGGGSYTAPSGPVGWNRWGIQQTRIARYDALCQRARMMQDLLEAKYAAQLQSATASHISMFQCSRPLTKLTTIPEFFALTRCEALVRPIGVIDVLGYTLSPVEVTNETASLAWTFTPSDDQRFRADVAIYFASQRWLFVELADNYIDDLPIRTLTMTNPTIGASLARAGGELDQLIAIGSKHLIKHGVTLRKILTANVYTTFIEGYSLNPIQPTEAELDAPTGFADYYARGGFLIKRGYADGLEPVSYGHPIAWTEGYFRCTSDDAKTQTVSKWHPQDFLQDGKPYAFQRLIGGDDGVGWVVFVKVGANYTIRLQPKDASTKTKILRSIVDASNFLFDMICTNASTINSINQDALTNQACFDKATSQPCKAGTPKCECAPATKIESGAIGVANGMVQGICALRATQAPRPPTPATPFAPPPDLTTTPTKIPWWLVVTGGVVVGAFLFARE